MVLCHIWIPGLEAVLHLEVGFLQEELMGLHLEVKVQRPEAEVDLKFVVVEVMK